MEIDNLKQQYKKRDRLISAMSKDGLFRIAFLINTKTAAIAQEKHHLDYISASLLARQLSASSLMVSFMKGEERIIIQSEGNGNISYIYSEAAQIGEVRGFVRHSKDYNPDKIDTYKAGLGIGLFKVSKALYDQPKPITGIVPLIKGDMTNDLAYYLEQSDQIASFVVLEVDLNEEGLITFSSGLIVQAMPGASLQQIETLFDHLKGLDKLQSYFDKADNVDETLQSILPLEYTKLKSIPIDFFCRCSKDRFMEHLILIGKHEVLEMKKLNQNELVCQYCNNKYYLTPEDFKKLIDEITIMSN